jgi:hypothetical protein
MLCCCLTIIKSSCHLGEAAKRQAKTFNKPSSAKIPRHSQALQAKGSTRSSHGLLEPLLGPQQLSNKIRPKAAKAKGKTNSNRIAVKANRLQNERFA